MKKCIALVVLGLALTGAGIGEAVPTLPWSTVSDLESHVTQAYALAGCADPRPMELYIVQDRLDTYRLVINADVRWAIIGPPDSRGATPIWYGTVSEDNLLVIERSLVGTPETDVCPLLMRQDA